MSLVGAWYQRPAAGDFRGELVGIGLGDGGIVAETIHPDASREVCILRPGGPSCLRPPRFY